MLCELRGGCYHNLLPVAGGGAPTLTLSTTVTYYSFLHPESSSEGIQHLGFTVSYQVSYLSRSVTIYLDFSCQFSVTTLVGTRNSQLFSYYFG